MLARPRFVIAAHFKTLALFASLVFVATATACSCTLPPVEPPGVEGEPEPDPIAVCVSFDGDCAQDDTACCEGLRCIKDTAAGERTCGVEDTAVVTMCDVNLEVFAPHCASCHNGSGALDLRATALRGALIGVPSSLAPDAVRVVAGAAADSLLYRKMSDTHGVGEGGVMPPSGRLNEAHLALVRQWIDGGASTDCTLPQPAGDACSDGSECISGVCGDGACVSTTPPVCAAEEGPCYWDGDCCTGFCALAGEIYGPGVCSPLLVDGEFCAWGTECGSNVCVDNQCTSACLAPDGTCDLFGLPCCPGSVCLGLGGYAPGRCDIPQAPGLFCETDPECASGRCVDFACAPLDDCAVCTSPTDCTGGQCEGGRCASACVEAEQECRVDGAACCSGVCHDTGYGWGSCGPPGTTGDSCWTDATCASGVCLDYQCT